MSDNGKRPYRSYYPGMLRAGCCKSPQSAARAAYAHLVNGEERRATIDGPDGTIAWLQWTPVGVVTRFEPRTREALRPKGKK